MIHITDTKSFKNPEGFWTHEGGFTVSLTNDAPLHIIPASATVTEFLLRVPEGRCYQAMGGIQLVSGTDEFYFTYRHMKAICRLDGSLIWINLDHRR